MSKGYKVKKLHIITKNGKMRLLVFLPENKRPPRETWGVLWLHGGGYMTGFPEMAKNARGIDLVKNHGAVMLAPDYTLSLKAPYPAALEDCYAALTFMAKNANALGFNVNKLAVGGESAGGGLAAALCILARDKGRIKIACQIPLCPMIDCGKTVSNTNNFHDPFWGSLRNKLAWKMYLGPLYGKRVPYYASASRCRELSGLPPCYTYVGEGEVFYSETVEFVRRLKEAGVYAECTVYKGIFHCHDMLLPNTKKGKGIIADFDKNWLLLAKQAEYTA